MARPLFWNMGFRIKMKYFLILLPVLALGFDEEAALKTGDHAYFLGNEPLDTKLFESFEGGSAKYEYDQIYNIFSDAVSVLRRNFPNDSDTVRRDAHAKSHGCVRGVFTVNNENLKPMHRVGVFRTNKSYPTWIRFSNNHSDATRHDNVDDLRGMSLKVLGVEGDKILPDEKTVKTQDFLLFGSPVFFLKDSKDYIVFLNLINYGTISAIWSALGSLGSVPSLIWGFFMLPDRLEKIKDITNPIDIPYFSSTPYRLGDRNNEKRTAVKYGIKRVACDDEDLVFISADKTDPKHPNYLRESLVKSLKTQAACFDFRVQPFSSSISTDAIEDPRIEWTSPWVSVAKLRIEKQEFDTPEQNEYCENLSFTPWHSLPDHRPLGRTNRARGILYNVISKHRHFENKVKRVEPTNLSLTKSN